ncbi:MAG: patatin-like phospholipase family protein [Acetobacteraceae bacterium]
MEGQTMNGAPASTAFVFAGGGSLGAVQVGMLRALTEAGVIADLVVGASVGAINAAYYASGRDLACVGRLEEIWRGLRRRDVFPFTWRRLFSVLRGGEAVFDPTNLRHLVTRNVPFERLEDAPIPVHMVATNLRGETVLLSSGPVVEAFLASSAIPAAFPLVRIGNELLMDGAVANNTPVLTAALLGARRIVVLPTGFACALPDRPYGAVARAMHALTLVIAQQMVRDLREVSRTAEVLTVPTLCPLAVSPFDFSHTSELIDRAVNTTRKWIAGGGLTRPGIPHQLVPHKH